MVRRSLRLLLLNQYYPPDLAPTGRALQDLERFLVSRGHDVRVVFSRQTYSRARRSKIRRILGYLAYLTRVVLGALRPGWRPDVILALTTPPYLGLVARCLAATRGAAVGHWLMDLYPDTMLADGMLRPGSAAARSFAWLTRVQLRKSQAIFVLGETMADRTRPYAPHAVVTVVPLWDLGISVPDGGQAAQRVRAERKWAPGDLVLLYSGNIGRGHCFQDFLTAADRLGQGGPTWAFAGDGYRRPEVARYAAAHPGARLQLWPYVPSDRLTETLLAADVHLVSLSRMWDGVMVPSKLQGAFALGRPVIFVGGPRNEAALWIAESGGGWAINEGDVDALIEAVEQASDPVERARRGSAALQFARATFDKSTNCGRIADIIESAAKA